MSVGEDLNSRVAPLHECVPLLHEVFLLFRSPLPPFQKCGALMYASFHIRSVTMVLLCKSSSSRSSGNYLQLRFTVQVGTEGGAASIPCQAFPCLCGGMDPQAALLAGLCLGPPGASSRLLGSRSRCCVRGCCAGVSLAVSECGAVSWAATSPGSPICVHPLQGPGRALVSPENCWEWKQLRVCGSLCK